MDWQALSSRQEFIVGSDNTAREIAGRIENARTARPQERVRHLPNNALQAIVEQRDLDAIEVWFHARVIRLAGDAPGIIDKLPDGLRSATAPGLSTTDVNGDSTIAGPIRISLGVIDSNLRTVALTQPSSAK